MRLYEMKQLPTRMGLAHLVWDDERDGEVTRSGPVIRIPVQYRDHVEFFPLLNGSQFVLKTRHEGLELLYFGGIEERPFLVKLRCDAFDAYKSGGEEGFFKHLKPEIVGILERELKVQAKRQGDIFAVPLTYSWAQLAQLSTLFGSQWGGTTIEEGHHVFGTRHVLKGLVGQTNAFSHFGDRTIQRILAEGTLSAPDHTDLKLKRPHLLVQTHGLAAPKDAD
jgi:hypothetical protein